MHGHFSVGAARCAAVQNQRSPKQIWGRRSTIPYATQVYCFRIRCWFPLAIMARSVQFWILFFLLDSRSVRFWMPISFLNHYFRCDNENGIIRPSHDTEAQPTAVKTTMVFRYPQQPPPHPRYNRVRHSNLLPIRWAEWSVRSTMVQEKACRYAFGLDRETARSKWAAAPSCLLLHVADQGGSEGRGSCCASLSRNLELQQPPEHEKCDPPQMRLHELVSSHPQHYPQHDSGRQS